MHCLSFGKFNFRGRRQPFDEFALFVGEVGP